MDEGKDNAQLDEPALSGVTYDGTLDEKHADMVLEEKLVAKESSAVVSELEDFSLNVNMENEDFFVRHMLDLSEECAISGVLEKKKHPSVQYKDRQHREGIEKENHFEQENIPVQGGFDTSVANTDKKKQGNIAENASSLELKSIEGDAKKWDTIYATELYQSMNACYSGTLAKAMDEQQNELEISDLVRQCNVDGSNAACDAKELDDDAYKRLGVAKPEEYAYEYEVSNISDMVELDEKHISDSEGAYNAYIVENNNASTKSLVSTNKRNLDIQKGDAVKNAAANAIRKAEMVAERIKEDEKKENEAQNQHKGGLKNIIKEGFHIIANSITLNVLHMILMSTAGLLAVVLFIIIFILFILLLVIISILSDPISFYFEGMQSDVVNDEAYITTVLDGYYSSFEIEIDEYIESLMKEAAPLDKEDEFQLDGTVTRIDDKETGDTNYNDLIVVYLTKMYAETNISPIKNGETYLIIDTEAEKKVLKETFDEMNFYITESEIVYNDEKKDYWQLNYEVEIKKLNLDEWKAEKGKELTEKQLKMLDKLRKTDITSLTATIAISGDFDAAASVFTDGLVSPFYVYSQSDSKWGNSAYYSSTLRKSGCGPSSCAMVISSLTGMAVTPLDVAKTAMNTGSYYVAGKGSTYTLIEDMCTKYGLSVQRVARTEKETIDAALREGKLCICIMGPGDFTSGGHFIVLRGITEKGYYLVGDSAGSKGVERMKKSWSPSILLKQVRNIEGGGVWIISKKDSK